MRHRLKPGRGEIDLGQRIRVALVFRLGLEDHAVLVGLAVDGGNLALAEGIAQGIDHGLHGDAEAAGGLAIDLDIDLETVVLRFRGDVLQRGRRPQLACKLGRPVFDFPRIGAGQRVLILRTACLLYTSDAADE